jgi:hypothetical protein
LGIVEDPKVVGKELLMILIIAIKSAEWLPLGTMH